MWTSRRSPAPGVGAHLQARLGSQGASPGRGDFSCRESLGSWGGTGMGWGSWLWTGSLMLFSRNLSAAVQHTVRLAGLGRFFSSRRKEGGIIRKELSLKLCHLTNDREFRKQPAPG